MIKGLVFGLIWGCVGGAVLLGIASLALPVPQRMLAEPPQEVAGTGGVASVPVRDMPAQDMPDQVAAGPKGSSAGAPPVGSEFARGGDDSAPDLPGIDLVPVPAAPDSPAQTQADLSAEAATDTDMDTETAPQPVTGNGTAGAAGTAALPAPGTAPVAPAPEEALPEAGQKAGQTAALTAPEAPQPETAPQMPSDLPEAGKAPAAAQSSGVQSSGFGSVPEISDVPGVRVNRGAGSRIAAQEVPEPSESPAAQNDLPALERNAVAPRGAVTGAPMSIVLMDDGPDSRLSPDLLADLPMQITVAVNPSAEGAAAAAKAYHAAGLEVVILADTVPMGATAGDLEQIWQGSIATLPQAVAVMDGPAANLQSNRPLARGLVGLADAGGYGLVTWDRGLDPAAQIAADAGLATVKIYRWLDGQGEEAPLIGRYLDRAAFEASRSNGVVVAGAAKPGTLGAILDWAVRQNRAVSFVPLSWLLLHPGAD